MTKSLKSISISLAVLFAVGLLILGAEAFRDSLDAKTQAIHKANMEPKYAYGQIVEVNLPKFYKTCNKTGMVTAFSHGIYDVSVLCDAGLLANPLRTLKFNESDIIRVIEEEN